jgi:hypothetical protein
MLKLENDNNYCLGKIEVTLAKPIYAALKSQSIMLWVSAEVLGLGGE